MASHVVLLNICVTGRSSILTLNERLTNILFYLNLHNLMKNETYNGNGQLARVFLCPEKEQ